MKNDVRKTIRIPKMFNDFLTEVAKEKGTTFNKLIENILYCYINNINELNSSGEILKKVSELQDIANDNKKKIKWQTILIRQMFLNSGFPRHRTVKEDKAYNEFMKEYYKID